MVNVIGLGYIGLPTALMMASHGVEVVGTDYNGELVATLNAGRTTFKEEGLDRLFAAAVEAGIRFTTEYQECGTYIVSVPTPYDKVDKKIDPSYVVAASKTVLEVAPRDAVLVIDERHLVGVEEGGRALVDLPEHHRPLRATAARRGGTRGRETRPRPRAHHPG